jgi:hypothetical protein
MRGEPVSADPSSLRRTQSLELFAPSETEVLLRALERLLGLLPHGRLADVLDIRWSVSFHRSGLRERYVTPHQPASEHARRFLGGGAFHGNGEVTRYRIGWARWWIDYDEDRLRKERNGVPDRGLFTQPKIVVCQNGRTLRAAYDEAGFVLKDTFLCGGLRDSAHPLRRHPRAIVGLLCSRVVHFFFSHVFYGGRVAGGYLHFLGSFLQDVPLGEWTDEAARTVSALVGRREALREGVDADGLEAEIEAHVSNALGLLGVEAPLIQTGEREMRPPESIRGPCRS